MGGRGREGMGGEGRDFAGPIKIWLLRPCGELLISEYSIGKFRQRVRNIHQRPCCYVSKVLISGNA